MFILEVNITQLLKSIRKFNLVNAKLVRILHTLGLWLKIDFICPDY